MRLKLSVLRAFVLTAAVLAVLFLPKPAEARSMGVGSLLFGANVNGCNACHGGGMAPTVMLSASSTALSPGDQITLTFSVTTPNGINGAAGFNLRSSKAGTFAVGGSDSAGTQVGTTLNGIMTLNGFSEATHTAPKAGEPAVFTVLWTPNAGTTGAVTFTAWGNAVNLSGNTAGDMAATTTLDISICVPQVWYRDLDADGFGAMASGTLTQCAQPLGYVADNTDCNDGMPNVHVGALELCNGVDENCNGQTDEGLATSVFYRDADGDTFGNLADTKSACSLAQAGAGYVANSTDCNDASAAIHPGATETCNGIDDNCAGGIDEGLAPLTFYRDADADTFGAATITKSACSLAQAGAGYVANSTDCNDANAAIHPGATETCNGIDDNCAAGIDEGLATSTFYLDSDGDTYGASAPSKMACNLAQAGANYVADHSDCDDTDPNVHPGAVELCSNAKDDNCNGTIDTDAPTASTFYRDLDGDGFGRQASGTVSACSAPTGYVSNNTDCNDSNPSVRPGAAETCNGTDDNCNNAVDEGITCGVDAGSEGGAGGQAGEAGQAGESGASGSSTGGSGTGGSGTGGSGTGGSGTSGNAGVDTAGSAGDADTGGSGGRPAEEPDAGAPRGGTTSVPDSGISPPDASSPAGASGQPGSDGMPDNGCSCRAAGSDPANGLLLGLAAMLGLTLMGRRRPRRRR